MNCEDNTDSRISHIFVFLRFTLFKILKSSFPCLSKVTEEVAAYSYIIVTSFSFLSSVNYNKTVTNDCSLATKTIGQPICSFGFSHVLM